MNGGIRYIDLGVIVVYLIGITWFGTRFRETQRTLKDYFLGGHPVWELCRVGFRMLKRPYFIEGFALGLGYGWAAVRRLQRPISRELMAFHRREQMRKLKAIFRSVLTFKPIDKFRLLSE